MCRQCVNLWKKDQTVRELLFGGLAPKLASIIEALSGMQGHGALRGLGWGD